MGPGRPALAPYPLGRVANRLRARHDLGELLLEDLGVEELLRVLPLVERLGLVEPLVTLQSDQLASGRGGDDLRQLGLAHAGGTFDQDRLLELLGEEHHGGDLLVADVALLAEALLDVVHGIEHSVHSHGAVRRGPPDVRSARPARSPH